MKNLKNSQTIQKYLQILFTDSNSKRDRKIYFYKVTSDDVKSDKRIAKLIFSILIFILKFTSSLLVLTYSLFIPFALIELEKFIELILILIIQYSGLALIFKLPLFRSNFYKYVTTLSTAVFILVNIILRNENLELYSQLTDFMNIFSGIIWGIGTYFVIILGLFTVIFLIMKHLSSRINPTSFENILRGLLISALFFTSLLYLIVFIALESLPGDGIEETFKYSNQIFTTAIFILSITLAYIPNLVQINTSEVLRVMKENAKT